MLDIDPVSMDIFGGTGKGSIHVDVTSSSPLYRLIGTLDRFRIEELIQASLARTVRVKATTRAPTATVRWVVTAAGMPNRIEATIFARGSRR